MLQVGDRAAEVLNTIGAQPETSAASGRYRRSAPFRTGMRYWSTSQPRLRHDFLGVQFFGRGIQEAERLRRRLEGQGFQKRTPQTGQLTFAKAVSYLTDGSLDREALGQVRDELDALIGRTGEGGDDDAGSLWEFMRNSPLADLNLDLERSGRWRDIGFLFEPD